MRYQIGEGETVETLEEIVKCQAQGSLQAAYADRWTCVCGWRHTFDEGFQAFEFPHQFADIQPLWFYGKLHSAAASADRVDIAERVQPVRNLGKVIARNSVGSGDLVYRHLPARSGKQHENAQSIIGLQIEMHKMSIS